MGFFDSSSDSSSLTSGSDQGSQAQDEATATNINLSAGDDLTSSVALTTNNTVDNSNYQVDSSTTDNSVSQVDSSVTTDNSTTDSSVTQIDNSTTDNSQTDNSTTDSSVTQIDNSQTDNSVSQVDSSTTTTNQYDQSQTYITTSDSGAIAAATTISVTAIDALNQQTSGLFATVDDILEGYGAQTDETMSQLAGSFNTSISAIADENTTAQESLVTNTFYLIGALAAMAGLAFVYSK